MEVSESQQIIFLYRSEIRQTGMLRLQREFDVQVRFDYCTMRNEILFKEEEKQSLIDFIKKEMEKPGIK